MPHIHVDFHEQGSMNLIILLQPQNHFMKLLAICNEISRQKLVKTTLRYFDQEGWLYFTRERFDLLYPSYGDTYPTFMGAIGMTYEQAGHGRAGLGINTDRRI